MLLENETDTLSDLPELLAVSCDMLAEDSNITSVRFDKPGNKTEQSGLASAIGADQRNKTAGRHFKANVVKNQSSRLERLTDVPHRNSGGQGVRRDPFVLGNEIHLLAKKAGKLGHADGCIHHADPLIVLVLDAGQEVAAFIFLGIFALEYAGH